MAQVFRKTSLEQAASPDSLDDYIQVSNPSVWMILAAIVLLLAGALVWACFGHLSDVQRGVLVVDGSQSVCYVDQSAADDLSTGDAVAVGETVGSVASVSEEVVPASALPASAQDAAAEDSGWYRSAAVSIDLPDGVYEAEVTLRSYNPVALLFAQE